LGKRIDEGKCLTDLRLIFSEYSPLDLEIE